MYEKEPSSDILDELECYMNEVLMSVRSLRGAGPYVPAMTFMASNFVLAICSISSNTLASLS
ncbi:MAG: hypothetical protein AOA65_0838 [Candidatus Bathyarchaeota archaeon BA1]|nr:MAG: hypothetical protein AOA65_0838 [Candidatus Bathyarchaeota archaeon BA1]